MNEADHRFVPVHTVSNRFEADTLLDALEREEIPTILRSFEETPYDGLFISQRGWGRILVPEELLDRARLVMEALARDIEKKSLYTDPGDVDPLLWETLREMDPALVSANAMVRFDEARRAFRVPFLDAELLCLVDEETVELARPAQIHRLGFELVLAVLHYLLESRMSPLQGQWVSEKDLPGGELFFRGPHVIPTDRLLGLFGRNPGLFREAAARLGGSPVPMADAGYRFWAFPRVPVLFLLWTGDDEFEPVMHVRFDRSVTEQIHTLDTLWALMNVVCRGLRHAGQLVAEEGGA
ncbi:MAG: DUF3786 domain-containing protein [Syntrophobacteraceae bacterium]|jgi:hypothetical protein|nr:DUF3786 domain-containing protein [Syntrophobacteraceae bacterium]